MHGVRAAPLVRVKASVRAAPLVRVKAKFTVKNILAIRSNMHGVRAAPLVRVKVKITVKNAVYAVTEDTSRTAVLTVIFPVARTSGA